MRRLLIAVFFSLPALALGGWLLLQQLPILLAPQWWWISANSPNGAPAACEAATSLRLYNGERVLFEQPPVSSEDAKAAADRLIAERYTNVGEAETTAVTPLEYGGPSLFRATLDSERRLVWLVTARVATSHIAGMPGMEMPGAAAIVYVDANTGEPLTLLSAAGAGHAPAMCPFPLRDWAVVTLRSTPFLALAGYVGLMVALGVTLIIYRIVRHNRHKSLQEGAHG
jgi:hypothetical protein